MPKFLKILAVLCGLFGTVLGGRLAWAQDASKVKIGFSIEAMKGERWQTDLDAFTARAKQLGAEVISSDANGDDDRQLEQVKDMIKAGVKVLVLLPHDSGKAALMVDAAKAANVKVISYDRLVLKSDVDLYLSFDRVDIGRMQTEYLVQHAPRGNYVLIGGSPGDEGAKTLHDEQLKLLRPSIARREIKVVADVYTKDWQPTEAYLHMLQAIDAAHGDIAAVVVSNDGMATGVIQALREHHLAGKVLVSGQDADLANVICIVEGTQAMTVFKPVRQEAARAAEEAVHLAKGESIYADASISNGAKMVPAILLKPVLVTKDNIKATVVQAGFQTLKDINQGLAKEQQLN